MLENYNYLIDVETIEEFISKFDNKSPFSLKKEFKEYKKVNNFKNDSECVNLLALEIDSALVMSDNSNIIYSCERYTIAIIKLRIKDESSNRGKSGGWRIIGLVDKIEKLFVLLSIYRHSSGKDDLSPYEKSQLRCFCDEYADSK